MEDQLITFKTAKLAKEKGFNELSFNYFLMDGTAEEDLEKNYFNNNIQTYKNINTISQSSQSLLQKWLRDIHNIIVLISPYIGETAEGWSGEIYINRQFGLTGGISDYDTYEEALEVGLQKALKSLNFLIK